MDDAQWAALTERAEADGISASEALRRLAARYAKGEIKVGPEVPASRPTMKPFAEAARRAGEQASEAVRRAGDAARRSMGGDA